MSGWPWSTRLTRNTRFPINSLRTTRTRSSFGGLVLLLVPVTLEVPLVLDDRECLLQQALILVLLFVPFFLYQNWCFHFQGFADRQDSTLQEESQGQHSSALPDIGSCHREWLHCRRHRSGIHWVSKCPCLSTRGHSACRLFLQCTHHPRLRPGLLLRQIALIKQ